MCRVKTEKSTTHQAEFEDHLKGPALRYQEKKQAGGGRMGGGIRFIGKRRKGPECFNWNGSE